MTGKLKKSAWAAFAAVNAVTLVNSFLIADRFVRRPEGPGFDDVLGVTIVAPIFTAENWDKGHNPKWHWGGKTPIGEMGNLAHKAPAIVDGTLNGIFSVAGAPGSWAGFLSGDIVGALTPSPKRAQDQEQPVGLSP